MQTRNLILTCGVAAFAAMAINANANDIVLSPRAAANQIQHVLGTGNDATTASTAAALSPRAAANQIQTVSGTSNDPAFTTACRTRMTGSNPKAIQACEANSTMPGCNAVTVAPLK